ncbi:MAG: sigma54 specific transcriptional regulator, Fis family [Deltaproteobacteria bacterium]|jgi:two-component system response regulator AtoC|nr:sigma54 specific transcriptional regulator, Fis family [Deltaproteobacteria bacterium]
MTIIDQLLIGQSSAIRKVKNLVSQVATSDLNAIISGESGVGKELVAQALHLSSHRKNRPFVKVNCAAIPSELLESELFGYEKGAFTGAERAKEGKFEIAHKGTIFLDEIGDMPLSLQSKMLQVLQDLHFSRLGGKEDVRVDCWVLAATNHDLEQDIRLGLFREDLYYRLNIIKIYIPPLRERPEDIEPLVYYFGRQLEEKIERPLFKFTGEILEVFRRCPWPGNVRELRNVVSRLMLLGDWDAVRQELLASDPAGIDGSELAGFPPLRDIEDGRRSPEQKFPSLKETKRRAVQDAERRLIASVLIETGWNRKKAAKILAVSYKALLYKIKELKLNRTD